jgi:hypothetical protein
VYLVHAVTQLVEGLRYKPEGRGFDFRLWDRNFYWYNPSGRTMTLGSIQPPSEMSAKNIYWVEGVNAAGAWGWQPYHVHVPIV